MDCTETTSKNIPKSLGKFFIYFLQKQPVAFFIFFIAPLTMILETTVIPYALKLIIDEISDYHGSREAIFSKIGPALWLAGISWISMIVIIRLQNQWQAYILPRFEAQVRMSMFDYLINHSYRFFSGQLTGNLASKVNELPRAMESMRQIICWDLIATSSSIVVALIFMATINIWFAVIFLIWIIFQSLISFYYACKINQCSKHNAEDKSTLGGRIVDALSNIGSIKLFAHERHELHYLQKSQQREMRSNQRLIFLMNYFRLFLDLPITIMLVLMINTLIKLWQRDMISTGDVVFIVNISFAIITQMWFLSHALADLFREAGIAKQALSLITTPIEIIDNKHAKPLKVRHGEIQFDNVTFHYNKGRNIFENKSIIIQAKQRVGLVGYSGSGKTTFIHLILRLFNLESGSILIDKQDISQVTQASLRDCISMIPQDTGLFNRTLIDNIRYGNIHASDEEVVAASKKAHCNEFILQLPQGYNTSVGEHGVKLSGGQRQRIAIARAILKKSPILILDEATSQLDSLTEELIQSSLLELMHNKTTLVVAHRLSTLLHMDRILVFEQGHIVEDGSHDELLAKKGLYSSMWEAQIGGFLPDLPDDSKVCEYDEE